MYKTYKEKATQRRCSVAGEPKLIGSVGVTAKLNRALVEGTVVFGFRLELLVHVMNCGNDADNHRYKRSELPEAP